MHVSIASVAKSQHQNIPPDITDKVLVFTDKWSTLIDERYSFINYDDG